MDHLWMSWSLDGISVAGAEVDDLAAAVTALDRSVAGSRRIFRSARAWENMRQAAKLVRAQMLDEGREVLEHGQNWSSCRGGVCVEISQRR
ncbi:hypothetical protein ACWEO4_48290 [Streptomyces sp. NPDC004393]|uniref:hypothetical protein n=1 Tax=Streptomyces sp. NPDC004533 TaxID=3154278 RepID=UPI0033AF2E41